MLGSNFMVLSTTVLLLASCSLELPDGAIRPVNEYCLPSTCAAGELCFEGDCYTGCETDDDCETGCCKETKAGELYCAPKEKC